MALVLRCGGAIGYSAAQKFFLAAACNRMAAAGE